LKGPSLAWVVFFVVLGLLAVLDVVINVNRLRFQRRWAAELAALRALPPSDLARSTSPALPAPVQRYWQLAVGERAPVLSLQLRHGGSFRSTPTGKAFPIQGTQLFTADPPGFVWLGRIRLATGVWIHARDMLVAGKGSMRVLLDDTLTLADASGAELDQGSLLRLLAEMPWYPTALFDARYVSWSPLDATHARATLRAGGLAVSGTFEFGPDGLPLSMSAERFMDGRGLTPWSGVYRDFRAVSGMLVPFEADVTWQLASGPYTYAHWLVASVDYD
jgi:hypothetical protein